MPVSGFFSKYASTALSERLVAITNSRKGIADRKDKTDSVQNIITSLSLDIPILELYKDMFPTNDMKQALTEFYIHTLDLLWRLSMYYSHNYFSKWNPTESALCIMICILILI